MNNTEFQNIIEVGDRIKLGNHSEYFRKFYGFEDCKHIPACVGCKGYIIVETNMGYSHKGCFRTSANGVLQIRVDIYKDLLNDKDFEL